MTKLQSGSLSLLTAAAALSLVLVATTAGAVHCGDSDNNGSITAVDALGALRSSVDLASPCDGNCMCDLNCDRELTSSDALTILRSAVIENEEGCCFIDECFNDEDCEGDLQCGTDPNWDCDAACVP